MFFNSPTTLKLWQQSALRWEKEHKQLCDPAVWWSNPCSVQSSRLRKSSSVELIRKVGKRCRDTSVHGKHREQLSEYAWVKSTCYVWFLTQITLSVLSLQPSSRLLLLFAQAAENTGFSKQVLSEFVNTINHWWNQQRSCKYSTMSLFWMSSAAMQIYLWLPVWGECEMKWKFLASHLERQSTIGETVTGAVKGPRSAAPVREPLIKWQKALQIEPATVSRPSASSFTWS